MALGANLVEHGPAARCVARLRTARPVNPPVSLDFGLLVGGALADRAVNFRERLFDLVVLQTAQLADKVGGQRVPRDTAVGKGSHQRLGKWGAGSQRVERVALLAFVE